MNGDEHDHNKMDVNKIVKMQNFIFCVFAYCTKKVYEQDDCVDDTKVVFLHWVLYGNAVICLCLLAGYLLASLPQIYHILNKFGAVVVTIFTYIFVGSYYIFNFASMIYGIKKHFWSPPAQCKELQLFLMVMAYIYVVWIFLNIYEVLYKLVIRYYPQETNQDEFLSGQKSRVQY